MFTPPLLATKLYIPPPRPGAVPRSRLIERLDAGRDRKLTLVAAPAGFGKTTLVAEWVTRSERRAAWLSLDVGDNDPARFLAYLVAALQTIVPQIGAGLVAVLQSPQPPQAEGILTALLNEITMLPDTVVLVLDDYHVIDATAVNGALSFLLEHLPPQLQLVIVTRADPPLPLARLRGGGKLNELRAADLRFTAPEAAAFLNHMTGLDLSATDLVALEDRTEGWIAGLQLAALSMQGLRDVPGFIRSFTGDNRYIVDYLVEEVLQRQLELVRSFLLQTSILDRLSGPLCDAVTGQEAGRARLDALERGNFFVVPLDNTRHWYRYHHLFADVLAAHLRSEQPELVPTLHRRASIWYEQHGTVADAVRHALAAADFARVADLIEHAWSDISRSRQESMVLAWLQVLPDELIRSRPVLSVGYAHVLLAGGRLDGVEERLQDAERWLETTGTKCMGPHPRDSLSAMATVVTDEGALRRLPGAIAVARTGQALARGDLGATVMYARRVLDLVPPDDHLSRGGGAAFLGLAAWASGDLETAHRMYAEGVAHLQRAGNISDVLNGTITLALIWIAQGRLREAMHTYEQALQLVQERDEPLLLGTADVYVGLSELYRERGDLPAATQHLLRRGELGEHAGFPQNRYRRYVAMALIQEAQGDLDGALDLLDEAERLYVSDFSPNVRPIAALRTRVWLAQGRVEEAVAWTHAQGLSPADDLSYVREFEHITLARVFLARYRRERAGASLREAGSLLDRLLPAAEGGVRKGSVIEILVLQALASQMRGDTRAALVPLGRALALAEPEGYLRIFVDEGTPMTSLLAAAAQYGTGASFARRLLAALSHPEDRKATTRPLIDPLSGREMEVLRLLRTDLSGPEIARALTVSLHTMRTHTNNIYSKLGMNSRRTAVRRAEELGLF